MAVLSTRPGIVAEVLIRGEPAKEYDDNDEIQIDHEDENVARHQALHTVSKYIQSETDQEFSIRFTVGAPYIKGTVMDHVRLGFHIYIDGSLVGEAWCSRLHFKHSPVGTQWFQIIKGITSQKGSKLKPFQFGSIATNSDDMDRVDVQRLAKKLKKVGVIEIRVHSETAGKVAPPKQYLAKDLLLQSNVDVPETALKGDAKTHGTMLGKTKTASKASKSLDNKQTSEDYPDIIFRFLYRDEESLKQIGVIDRTPEPSVSPSASRSASPELDQHVSSEPEPSRADKLELALAQAMLALAAAKEATAASKATSVASRKTKGKKKNRTKIKRERDEGGREVRKAKKARRSSKPAVPVYIDLTGDSDDEGDMESVHDQEIVVAGGSGTAMSSARASTHEEQEDEEGSVAAGDFAIAMASAHGKVEDKGMFVPEDPEEDE